MVRATLNDVILIKGQIWVSEAFLLINCDGLTEEYLRQCRHRYRKDKPTVSASERDGKDYALSDSGKSWRFGRWFSVFYYCVDSIPSQEPCCYSDQLPMKDELKKQAVKYK